MPNGWYGDRNLKSMFLKTCMFHVFLSFVCLDVSFAQPNADRLVLTLGGGNHSQRDVELYMIVAAVVKINTKRYPADFIHVNSTNWNLMCGVYEEDMLALLEAGYSGRLNLGEMAYKDLEKKVLAQLNISKYRGVSLGEVQGIIRKLKDISSFYSFQKGGNPGWKSNAAARHKGFWHSKADVFQSIVPIQ